MRELKKLYHRIVKALHPDLNPNLTQAQLNLFNNAVNAYESGDLNTLSIISVMVSELILSDIPHSVPYMEKAPKIRISSNWLRGKTSLKNQ